MQQVLYIITDVCIIYIYIIKLKSWDVYPNLWGLLQWIHFEPLHPQDPQVLRGSPRLRSDFVGWTTRSIKENPLQDLGMQWGFSKQNRD